MKEIQFHFMLFNSAMQNFKANIQRCGLSHHHKEICLMLDAYIYDGLRSPFGRHAGALAPLRPDDLVAEVMRALVARNPWQADQIEDVILGDTNQAGEDSRNVARN